MTSSAIYCLRLIILSSFLTSLIGVISSSRNESIVLFYPGSLFTTFRSQIFVDCKMQVLYSKLFSTLVKHDHVWQSHWREGSNDPFILNVVDHSQTYARWCSFSMKSHWRIKPLFQHIPVRIRAGRRHSIWAIADLLDQSPYWGFFRREKIFFPVSLAAYDFSSRAFSQHHSVYCRLSSLAS